MSEFGDESLLMLSGIQHIAFCGNKSLRRKTAPLGSSHK